MDNPQEQEPTTLAVRVRQLMDTKGDRRPADAQKRTGLSYSTIHEILNEKRLKPDAATLQKIASAYDVSIGWLMGDDSDTPAVHDGGNEFVPRQESPVQRLKAAFSSADTLLAHPEYKEPKRLAAAVARRAAEMGLSPEEIAELVEWSMREPTPE